jgi:pyruvate/2-oxoglutarate dehydrogenase complex dihydrolipoamide dehydrogenase (E3) component
VERLNYDLVVVGAGSGGYAAARTARDCGDCSIALVDRGPLGGLCILRGCMPSKALLASSDALYDMGEAAQLGIHAGAISADVPFVVARKRELVRGFADYRIEGIESFPLYRGAARFISRNELQVGDDVILQARKFIIATGSLIAPPAIDGLADAGYFDSDAALEREQIPKSLIVLGGGYVACELGQYFARMGAKTTFIIRAAHLLSGADDDVGNELTECFRQEGIEVVTGAKLVGVKSLEGKKAVRVVVDGVDGEIVADEIFYALGRVPDIEGLGLDVAGVDAHPTRGIAVDGLLRTSNPHIYAIGDVTGIFALVHVAIYQGEVAARNALRDANEKANYDIVAAHTVFSDPQVAVVGKIEKDLKRAGTLYVKGTYAFAEHGKAMTLGKTKGFVKLLAEPTDGTILGATVIGPQASELIHEMIVAMNYNSTVQEFVRIPHLHPTLAEIWTYPAEECAEQIGRHRPGDDPMELATSVHAH